MTKDEALRLALEYVELVPDDRYNADHIDRDALITAIKAALEAKDEPVAWMDESRFKELHNGFTVMTTLTKKKAFFDDVAIYTTLPQRKPLTDEEIVETFCKAPHQTQHVAWFAAGVRYAEAAHGIKGEA